MGCCCGRLVRAWHQACNCRRQSCCHVDFSAEAVRGLPAALAVTSVDEDRSGKHRCCLHPHRQRPLWVGLEALEVGTSEKEGSADMASDLCC